MALKKFSASGIIFFLHVLSVELQGQSQFFSSSRVYIQTNYHKEVCFSFSSEAYISYDANKQDLLFSIDFATFKVGVDSLDEWLQDLSDSKLNFSVHLPEAQMPPPTNNASRLFHLNGDLTMNGKTNKHVVDAVIFSTSDQNTQHKTSSNSQFDKLRIHLSVAFLPKEFGVDKRPHHLKKSIVIKVADGFINYVKQ
ncbi:MAG: YceI family protein [Bacteroidota bacterium]|jgi:hypothetical protein